MKVLLLTDVPNVGKKRDVKEVNEGFARNFLLPRKLAVPATEDRLQVLAHSTALEQQRTAKNKKIYEDINKKLASLHPIITVKVGEKGKAFGSVGPQQIIESLQGLGVDIKKEWIAMDDHLKATGAHQIPVAFPHGVHGTITITIKAE